MSDPVPAPAVSARLPAGLAATVALGGTAMIGIGALLHSGGPALACPDWPLCDGNSWPGLDGRQGLEWAHRLVANGVGVAALALVAVSIRPGRRGLGAVAAVVLQGALLTRAGALVTLARASGQPVGAEPGVLLVGVVGVAAAVLTAAWVLWRRSGDPRPALALVVCEGIETLSALGAAGVLFEPPVAVRALHFLAALGLVGLAAWLAGAWLEALGPPRPLGATAMLVAAAVTAVVVLGAWQRHGGGGVALATAHRWLGLGALAAALWWTRDRPLGGAVLAGLLALQVALGLWRPGSVAHVLGAEAVVVALVLALAAPRPQVHP